MNDFYRPPESDLNQDVPQDPAERKIYNELQALRMLFKAQRVYLSPVVSLILTVALLLTLEMAQRSMPLWVLVFPSFIVGGVVKYIGRLIEAKHRIIAGVIVGLLVCLWLGQGLPFIAVLVGFINIVVFVAISRRPLTFDEEKLLSKKSLGKLKP